MGMTARSLGDRTKAICLNSSSFRLNNLSILASNVTRTGLARRSVEDELENQIRFRVAGAG
jgi:hypothetical protein